MSAPTKQMAASPGRADRAVPDGRMDFDVEIPMRDGTILRCDVYRPAGDAPVPAILQRTPYDKRLNHGSHMGLDMRATVARGYAMVVQDVRGRFASEGEFLLTPTQAVEGPDGYDTIEWIANQHWCSGAVGMIGSSYASLTQWMAACEHPPSLKAIVPEKTGIPGHGAILLDSIMLSWTAGQAMDWLQKAMLRQEAGEKEAAIIHDVLRDPQTAAKFLPLNAMPLRSIGGLPSFQEVIDLLHGESGMDIASVEVPALIVSSWYDMRPRDAAEFYEILRRKGIEANILFGPWDHGHSEAALGEAHFGAFAHNRLIPVSDLYLNFYDRHLKGDKTKPAPGARYFVMGANEWRSTASWPPPSRPLALYLHSANGANGLAGDGTLSGDRSDSGAPCDRYSYDPLDPVPTAGGRNFDAGGSRAGPFNQRRVEERPDVLVYTSAPYDKGLEISGPVKVRLFVSCSTPDTDVVVKVCDVRPDGLSHNIIDEFYRCRWREGYDRTLLFEPDTVYRFDIDMGPVAHYFKPGHRVRVQVTSSNFPAFDRNMNTGHAIGVDARGDVAEITIYHDAERPSCVVLSEAAAGGR